MNLADFQLDMDMLQTMTSQQQQSQSQQAHVVNGYERLDMLFQDGHPQDTHFMNMATSKATTQISTPVYHATHPSNEYFDQSDMLTPLISPAMTPSFSYSQKMNSGTIGSDIDFSPLSSPVMMPQQDQDYADYPHQYQQQLQAQHQQSQYHQLHQLQQNYQAAQDSLSPSSGEYPSLSTDQMCEQYEQLENAKRMITRRLSELQKRQLYQDSHGEKLIRNMSTRQLDNPLNHDAGDGSNRQTIEPVTPASLMNMRERQKPKVSFSQLPDESLNPKDKSYDLNSARDASGFIATPPTSSNGKRKTKSKVDTTKAAARKRRRSSSGEDRQSHNTNDGQHHKHVSPRALKPLLVSPSLGPDHPRLASSQHRPKPLQPLATQPHSQGGVPMLDDAEHILATRSNYQNLMEGKAAALGIAFTSQIKSGLEVRRTAHKAAEQKRRDSLKEWFDRLRHEVEEGYVKKKSGLTSKVIREQQREKRDGRSEQSQQKTPDDDDGGADDDEDTAALKPLSKVLLLRYAYEYISHLKDTLAERDNVISGLTNRGSDQLQKDGVNGQDMDESQVKTL